jgi:hypothetical protein
MRADLRYEHGALLAPAGFSHFSMFFNHFYHVHCMEL